MIVRRDSWGHFYETEKAALEKTAGDRLLVLEHVGSTAIAGLATKPVIDILAGTRSLEDAPVIAAKLQTVGYVQIPFRPAGPADVAGNVSGAAGQRLFFSKRTAATPERVDLANPGYNIHVVSLECFHQDEQLLFRDYLCAHPEVAAEYARLKCDIVGQISDYREYTPAKNKFIQRVLAEARAELGAARNNGDHRVLR